MISKYVSHNDNIDIHPFDQFPQSIIGDAAVGSVVVVAVVVGNVVCTLSI